MRLLLDTHTLIWFLENDARLSMVARQSIEQPEHDIFVSVATLWEISIKTSLGKLKLPRPFGELFPEELEHNRFDFLPISYAHLNRLTLLTRHHRDPFDRLLIAQALEDDLSLSIVTRDAEFLKYPARTLW